jgi:long-subunit fatty acid transport protein
LQSTDTDGVLQYKYRGEGGLNKVFLGFGYQLTDNFKLGMDASYNFGSIKNTNIAFGYNPEGGVLQFQSRESNRSNLGGLMYNFGFIFSKLITPNFELTASATYSPSSELTSDNSRTYSTIVLDPITEQEFTVNSSEIDLSISNLATTKLTLPSKTSFGFGVGAPRKWFAGVEYTYLKASQFSNRLLTIDNATYQDASTLSIGGFYIPKYDSFNRYWKRIVYRTGIRFEDTGLRINNEEIKEFGISFGVGLPVGRIFSNANLGFEFGSRGVNTANLVKENFIKFQLSLSLNDRWFEKRKFN